ncbi:hypothetical protein [Algoriphagus mannitolivorans]|uniref:hypothetical protein n=1 Tax=Algoriphagus mannitolivorans TaxID=226504 RepID=UPI00041182B2|nr:hypothetical protein [Algoriphagus mannitolivorans]
MELEEMKSLWEELSLKVEQQEKIQKKVLMELTQNNYRKRLNSIRIPELLGSVVCLGYAAYFILNFSKLTVTINQIFAAFDILFLIGLPIASLLAIRNLNQLNIVKNTPAKILEKFAKRKIQFLKVQQFGLIFSGLFLISALPPLAEIAGKADIIQQPYFWLAYVPAGLLFIYFFGRWGIKKYQKVIKDSEEMIRGLED